MQTLPILYSFRRCPYAIRARLALHYARCPVELREVVLKDKPQALIDASPKATVPVLVLPGGDVLDESLDIINWGLARHDPDDWRQLDDAPWQVVMRELITENDKDFKPWLDRYKYADRHPEHPPEFYREQVTRFLGRWNTQLAERPYLSGDHLGLADMALFPFVRQCAFVDKAWFDAQPLPHLQQWLETQLESERFRAIMKKYPAWAPGDAATVVFANTTGSV